MKQSDFLNEFLESDFPHEKGPWKLEECFDPPYKESDLKQMEKAGLIERESGKFRLTLQAAKARSR